MRSVKKMICLLTALVMLCAAALPAFAERVTKNVKDPSAPLRGAGTGDVNQNGVIEAADALLILRYALGLIQLSPEQIAICDADGNGQVETSDALIVLRIAILPQETPAFFLEIKAGEPAYADIDGDGADDAVLVEDLVDNEEMEWEIYLRITITLAAAPDDPFVLETPFWSMSAAIADCIPDDGRLTVIVSAESDEDDKTMAIRVDKDGTGFETFTASYVFGTERSAYQGFPEDFVYLRSEGLPMMARTEIFGTYYLNGRFTVEEDGFVNITERYSYPEIWTWPLTLKRPMDVTLEDGTQFTVPTGDIIIPRFTDMATYAVVEIPDGRLGRVEVSFRNYRILINGIDQDEYADMPYAD